MSKLISLTQGKFAIVDDVDFEWLNQWKWYALKPNKKGSFYAVRKKKNEPKKQELVYMHRQIMNAQKGWQIDHHNSNGLDNQRNNLRFCTNAQNAFNQQSSQTKYSSKYKGVSLNKRNKKWQARICFNRKLIELGFFIVELNAARAYDRKARELFGEFARTNFED